MAIACAVGEVKKKNGAKTGSTVAPKHAAIDRRWSYRPIAEILSPLSASRFQHHEIQPSVVRVIDVKRSHD